MTLKAFAILIVAGIFMIVIDLIRQQKMSFKFALSWLTSCFLVLILAVNNQLIGLMAKWTGFELQSNFIFFVLMVFVILLSLSLSIYINEQNNRTETLAQTIAILDYKIKKLEEKD